MKVFELSESTPSEEDILAALEQHGHRAAFNRAGKRYRELGLAARIEALSTAELVELLSLDWRLLKRPFIIADSGEITLGFKSGKKA